MRLLVCGGRDYSDEATVWRFLYLINPEVVIQGGAKGADLLAKRWALHTNTLEETYYADWEEQGNAAGAIRNRRMIVEGKPDVVAAFPGGRGTANMIQQALAAHLIVLSVVGKTT